MPDALGWRMKFGVIAPSTNAIVQPEFDAMRPIGVTNHFGRIHIPNQPLNNDTRELSCNLFITCGFVAPLSRFQITQASPFGSSPNASRPLFPKKPRQFRCPGLWCLAF